MNTKLTLSIQKDVIEMAKEYAKEQNRSLSDLVENILLSLATKETNITDERELSPRVKALMGSIKAPKNFDAKKILQERREKKYL